MTTLSISQATRTYIASNNKEEFVHQWITESETIRILQKGNALEYSINTGTQKGYSGPLNFSGLKVNEVIACLSVIEPTLSSDGSVHFKTNQSVRHKWTWNGKIVSLLEKNNIYSWELFDRTTKTTSRVAFQKGFFSKYRQDYWYYGYQTDIFFNQGCPYEIRPIEERRLIVGPLGSMPSKICDYLASCIMENVEIVNNELQSVVLTPYTFPCQMLEKTFITQDIWAVSLIDISPNDNPHGHAVLLIETVRESGYRMYKAHLTAKKTNFKTIPGIVKWGKVNKLEYREKYKTWLREKFSVKRMITEIKYQIKMQNSGLTAVFFNPRGPQALFVKKETKTEYGICKVHNCLTWAEEILKIADIYDQHEEKLNLLYTTPQEYKKRKIHVPSYSEAWNDAFGPQEEDEDSSGSCVIL